MTVKQAMLEALKEMDIPHEYLRDIFAATALTGLLANPQRVTRDGKGRFKDYVHDAYLVADIAMKVRKETYDPQQTSEE